MKVFLDDKRSIDQAHGPNKGLGILYGDPNSWLIVRTLDDFKDVIESSFDKITLISLDHDLGLLNEDGTEQDGKDAAEFLIEYCLDNNKKMPDWYVHSDNNVGVENIVRHLLNYMKNIEGVSYNYSPSIKGYIKNRLV